MGDMNINMVKNNANNASITNEYMNIYNGKSMVESILSKINSKLKFLYRKQKFLNNWAIRVKTR